MHLYIMETKRDLSWDENDPTFWGIWADIEPNTHLVSTIPCPNCDGEMEISGDLDEEGNLSNVEHRCLDCGYEY